MFVEYDVKGRRIDGFGIGRYSRDPYDGAGNSGGNPWYVTTCWFAQYYYQLALQYSRNGKFEINDE